MNNEKQTQLEETLAYHEQQIHDLSEMVTRAWNEIDLLNKRLSKMQSKIEDLESAGDTEGGDGLSVSEIAARDKPPHY